MKKSTIVVPKKSRGRPEADTDRIVVRVQRVDLDALDKFRDQGAGGSINRPEAVRRILNDWLKSKGFLQK